MLLLMNKQVGQLDQTEGTNLWIESHFIYGGC